MPGANEGVTALVKHVSPPPQRPVELWDATTGQRLLAIKDCNDAEFSPDGRRLATWAEPGRLNGSVQLRDAATGKLLTTLKDRADGIVFGRFSLDSKYLALGLCRKWNNREQQCETNTIARLWEVPSSKRLTTIRGVRSASFSPDGTRLATINEYDDSVQLWTVATNKLLFTINQDTENTQTSVGDVVFSPDGRHLAVELCQNRPNYEPHCTGDKKVTLWDAATGKPLGNKIDAYETELSPNWQHLVATGYGGGGHELQLWNLAKSKLQATLKGHSGSITSMAFSPDGKLLVSVTSYNMIQIWEVYTNKLLATVRDIRGWVRSLAITSDNKWIALITDNKMTWVDINKARKLFNLSLRLTKSGADWVISSPDGFVDASPRSLKDLSWKLGNKTYEFAHFKQKYHVRDLWSQALRRR